MKAWQVNGKIKDDCDRWSVEVLGKKWRDSIILKTTT